MSDMPSITELTQAAQKMQDSMREAQEDITRSTVTGTSSHGVVTITMNGSREIKQVQLSPIAMTEDKEFLQALILGAIDDCIAKIDALTATKLQHFSHKLGLPTMPQTPDIGQVTPPSLTGLAQAAQQLQENIRNTQEEIAREEVTGAAGGDLVQITLTGKHKIHKIHISDEAMQEDKAVLQDLIAAAFNDSIHKIEKLTESKMFNLVKNLKMPPDFDLPKDA